MPPILSRQELLAEIQTEYDVLQRLLGRIPQEAMRKISVNSAGWTLKDVLAHIADWADRCEQWCLAGARGAEATPPAPGYKWNETRRLNRDIFEKRKRHPLPRVLFDFQSGHQVLSGIAGSMDEIDLCQSRRFAWCGPTWSVGKHIRANTASHYRWASKHCRRVLRMLAEGESQRRPSHKRRSS